MAGTTPPALPLVARRLLGIQLCPARRQIPVHNEPLQVVPLIHYDPLGLVHSQGLPE